MHPLFFNGLVLLGTYMIIIPDSVSTSGMLALEQDGPIKKCRHSIYKSRVQAVCSHLDLDHIPENLQSNIKVLDMSFNRLRVLDSDSLSRYTSLIYLDLSDNFIIIKEGAFSPTSYLEALDLSKNNLQMIPASIFSLPYLRNLYLNDNLLVNEALPKVITSPLQSLQLGNNMLTQVPEIGNQTELTYLNLSNNAITNISPENIASLCSLNLLNLTNNKIRFDNSDCDCHVFNAWVKGRGITVLPTFDCNKDKNKVCMSKSFTNRTMALHGNCMEAIKINMANERAKKTWIIAASCASGLILCVFIALCCLHRRNKKRRRQRVKDAKELAMNNANTELLNSNLKEQT